MNDQEKSVAEIKQEASIQKERLKIRILMYQNRKPKKDDDPYYTPEILDTKTLKQLQRIYDKVVS